MKKPSPAVIAMLKAIRDTGDAGAHLRGNSEHGGAGQTISAIRAAGWAVMGTKAGERDSLTIEGQKVLLIHEQ